MARSVVALVAGFLVTVVLAFSIDLALRVVLPNAFDAKGRTDEPTLLALTLVWVASSAIVGYYVTGRMAPSRPLQHALILGVVALALSIAGSVATWNTAPLWYHIVALLLILPCAYFGGSLAARHRAAVAGTAS